MTITNTTTLNDLLPSIVAEALFVASEKSIMRGLVRNYPDRFLSRIVRP